MQLGPRVARLFQLLLALVFADAWGSFLFQAVPLLGNHGIFPVAKLLTEVQAAPPWYQWPTLLRLLSPDVVDGALWVTGVLGLACSSIVLFSPGKGGMRARVALGISTVLYLSMVQVGGPFFGVQWDNLLLECGAFSVLLPTDRRAPVMHTLFRLLLFKLYFESGLAKLESDRGDWLDGTAMTHYFETAPLPTFLALYLHALPTGILKLLSFATLALELLVPFLIFGWRWMRLVAFFTFATFQLFNALTANYGFFCYISVALGVFLFDENDVAGWLVAERAPPYPPKPIERVVRTIGEWGALLLFVAVSVANGAAQFVPGAPAGLSAWTAPLAPFRMINNYHLFSAITVDRIEPEFQAHIAPAPVDEYMPLPLHHKPGELDRRPDFVAPHQPRLDFQLWFYGLSFRRTPLYVANLLDRLCTEPHAVQPFFAVRLPETPDAVRIVFWQYHFTTPSEVHHTGQYWSRTLVAATQPQRCSEVEEAAP